MVYFMDGEFMQKEDLKISIDDRGYYFGDGVYEVVKVYNKEIYTGEEHFTRLFESARKIKLVLPFTKQQLIDVTYELINRNNISNGHVYLQVTRGSSFRQHNFPSPAVPAVVVAYTVDAARPLADMENGVTVKSVDDIRWLRCDIKSLNLLGSVLAKEEAREAGCMEAMLHRDGVVTEGSSTNMFAVLNGAVHTHPVTNLILEGITRNVVLELCEQNGIPVIEEAFNLKDVFDMDEIFYTSTTAEVMPVTEVDGCMIGNGQPGLITKKLQEAFSAQIPVQRYEKVKDVV